MIVKQAIFIPSISYAGCFFLCNFMIDIWAKKNYWSFLPPLVLASFLYILRSAPRVYWEDKIELSYPSNSYILYLQCIKVYQNYYDSPTLQAPPGQRTGWIVSQVQCYKKISKGCRHHHGDQWVFGSRWWLKQSRIDTLCCCPCGPILFSWCLSRY